MTCSCNVPADAPYWDHAIVCPVFRLERALRYGSWRDVLRAMRGTHT